MGFVRCLLLSELKYNSMCRKGEDPLAPLNLINISKNGDTST